MPQISMVQIVALAIAAGVTAAVIGLAMAVAQAKVKMLMELTGKAMAQKIIDHRELKTAAAVDALASRVADDMDGDLARQSFADAARDAGMTPEEAQQHWWETESARSFNADNEAHALLPVEEAEDGMAIAIEARRIHWNNYYVDRALDGGLTYEEAIAKVDLDEERIATAMAYLELGHPVWMAIDMANADDMSDTFDYVDRAYSASDFDELTDDDLMLAAADSNGHAFEFDAADIAREYPGEEPYERQERLDREMMLELESRKAVA